VRSWTIASSSIRLKLDSTGRKGPRKEALALLATRKFGTTCPICKRFCFLSYIEIEETASVGELRAKLLRQGWLGEQARCDDPKCGGETFCAWNQAVFPR
jgi:hypothetical protein